MDDYRNFLPTFLVEIENLTPLRLAQLVAEKYRVAKLLAQDQIDLQEALVLTDANITLTGKEIYSTDFPRVLDVSGSNPPGMPSIAFRCPNLKLINCHLHDTASVGWWNQSSGAMKGCLIQRIGWDAPDRGHGHSLYTQGQEGLGKSIEGCIFVKGMGDNVTIYGSSESTLKAYDFRQNIVHGYRLLVGGSDVQDVDIVQNFLYGGVQLGYNTRQNKDSTFAFNTLIGNLGVNLYWEGLSFHSNLIVGDVTLPYGMFYQKNQWENNLYIGTRFTFDKHPTLRGKQSFEKWQAETGWDAHSSWYPTLDAAIEAGGRTLTPTYYPVNQGKHIMNIAVWNPKAEPTMLLRPPNLWNGTFELRQVRSAADKRLVTQVEGQGFPVSMVGDADLPSGLEVDALYHANAVLPGNFPQFGVFELWEL